MKTAIYLIALSFLLAANACRRNDTKPAPPKEQLPPYTKTGANTFGCLIDGEVFVPKKKFGSLSIPLQCYYQFVNGSYIFVVSGVDYVTESGNTSVSFIGSQSYDFLNEGDVYFLSKTDINSFLGKMSEKTKNDVLKFYTNDSINGSITISHLDKTKQIVSGIFSYDVIDTATGITKHITDGRFDVSYYK